MKTSIKAKLNKSESYTYGHNNAFHILNYLEVFPIKNYFNTGNLILTFSIFINM